jgi:hypothetical protein
MDAPFGRDQLAESARIAAEALKGEKVPIDRSFKWNMPEQIDQAWIDDVVLQAHMVAPIWSDYALIRERPDIWGMAFYSADNVEDRIVLVADDSLVVASDNRVEMLITATPVAGDEAIYYQLGCHCFSMNPEAFFYPLSFRDLAQTHGLLGYPDSDLIDELGLWQTGRGAEAYIEHERRTRPVFVLRRQTNLPTAVKKFQSAAKTFLSGFGPVIVNDALFTRYRDHLSDRKYGIIAIAPGGQVFPLERDGLIVPKNFPALLECCEIEAPASQPKADRLIGESALAAWGLSTSRAPTLEQLRHGGTLFRQGWEKVLEQFAPLPTPEEVCAEEPVSDAAELAEAEAGSLMFERVEPLKLDADGYPVDASDISQWADAKFGDRIVIAPRARRALTKSRHPEPRRIAEALEVLAGPKWRGYLGETETVAEFEAGLLKLRMRDGFSNAERLKGQTGADYILDHGGRRLLLERHLRSNSSGFNDPRMIRIYYVFDKLLRKIVVGWLPGHLRTSQS